MNKPNKWLEWYKRKTSKLRNDDPEVRMAASIVKGRDLILDKNGIELAEK